MDALDQIAPQAVEESCRAGGVTRPDVLEACIFDVMITGDEGFVHGHFSMQESLPLLSEGPTVDGANRIVVGPVEFEGFTPGRCTADSIEFTADGSFPDPLGQVELTIQYVATEPPILRVFVRVDGQYLAWADTTVDPPSAILDTIDMSGSTLTASGVGLPQRALRPRPHPHPGPPAG
ncbi:MAG TPA: hypothetical protein VFS66_13665 [Acidimicrobiia bacterium]|nr:hypothetical protein [Acidimicrobiia bacterium]